MGMSEKFPHALVKVCINSVNDNGPHMNEAMELRGHKRFGFSSFFGGQRPLSVFFHIKHTKQN